MNKLFKSEHLRELVYYTSDDGIWLQCSCGHIINLGWDATPKDAINAEKQHLKEEVGCSKQK